MQYFTFSLATFLALVYAAILFGQDRENQALQESMITQRTYQMKLLRAEETNQFTHQLVQRVIVEAATDPALASVLRDNGLELNANSSNSPASPPVPLADPQKNSTDAPVDFAR